MSDARQVYRHVKRGTDYEHVGLALLQCEYAIGEGSVLVIYKGGDGRLWARPHDEFHDGRFVRLALAPDGAPGHPLNPDPRGETGGGASIGTAPDATNAEKTP